MNTPSHDEIRRAVRERYEKTVTPDNNGCNCSSLPCCEAACCGTSDNIEATAISLSMGYSGDDVTCVPKGANLGLGCGNPQAIAALETGETVLDLGSGGGFDCFLAARAVGKQGHVIGVDMTPEMITKSRQNKEKTGLENVEFRLGEIENLPVADAVVSVIISNCVINLSPEKEKVFTEAFRVLKPGGRLAISDVVRTADMPDFLIQDMALYTGCIAGASTIIELESMLQQAGFEDIQIRPKAESKVFIRDWAPESKVEDYVVSATIEAIKPVVQ